MFGDRIQQSTTSTGAVLTLSASPSTNMRLFSAAFSTAGQNVQYSMRSADGTEWEDGFGRLTGALQLTRDYATANNGSGAPSVQTFSAGTKYVTCTPVGRGLLSAMPPVIAGSAPKIVSNRFHTPSGTAGAVAAGRVYYLPLLLEQACRIASIGYYNDSHSGFYSVDGGIYNVIMDPLAANPGLPGALLHNATGITIAGNGWQTMLFASPVVLSPGPYFMAIVFTDGAGLVSNGNVAKPATLSIPSWLGVRTTTLDLHPYTVAYETSATLPATANTTQTLSYASGASHPYVALGAE